MLSQPPNQTKKRYDGRVVEVLKRANHWARNPSFSYSSHPYSRHEPS